MVTSRQWPPIGCDLGPWHRGPTRSQHCFGGRAIDQGLRAMTLDIDNGLHDEATLGRSSMCSARVASEEVRKPGKVLRLGAMATQLLEEVRRYGPLDEASRSRVRQIYDESIRELAPTLSPDLADELARMQLTESDSAPSVAELRVAQAQLVGWLDGLLKGINASLLAQQLQAQIELRQQEATGSRRPPGAGTYL